MPEMPRLPPPAAPAPAPPTARREVHGLRLPRLATGVLDRCREVERVAFWDEVPVSLPTFSADEAPLALRWGMGAGEAWIASGVAYDRAGRRGEQPSETWDAIVRDVEPLVQTHLRMAVYRSGSIYERLLPWVGILDGASRKRGISREGEVGFRDLRDDGRSAQAALARELASRLAVVDGTLCIRAGLPRLRVVTDERSVVVQPRLTWVDWDEDPSTGDPWTADCFRVDRPEEAESYARALSRHKGLPYEPGAALGALRVLDPDALGACYDRVAGEDALALAGVARTVAEALRESLGLLPDAEIARYLELRALARSYDADGIRAWLEGLPGTRAALAAAHPPYPSGQPRAGAKHVETLDAVALRLDVVDFPRMNMADDAPAISTL